MDGFPWEVDVLQQKADALEARLDHMGAGLSGQHGRRRLVWMYRCFETQSHRVPADGRDSDRAVDEK